MPEGTMKTESEIRALLLIAENRINDGKRGGHGNLSGIIEALEWVLGDNEETIESEVGYLEHIYESKVPSSPRKPTPITRARSARSQSQT